MKYPKPKWWRLYALLPLEATLLVGAELVFPSAGWRVFAQCTASLVVIGAMALWVRANRVPLALFGEASGAGRPLHAWVAYCPLQTPRRRLDLPEITHFEHQVVPTEPMDREDVICCAK